VVFLFSAWPSFSRCNRRRTTVAERLTTYDHVCPAACSAKRCCVPCQRHGDKRLSLCRTPSTHRVAFAVQTSRVYVFSNRRRSVRRKFGIRLLACEGDPRSRPNTLTAVLGRTTGRSIVGPRPASTSRPPLGMSRRGCLGKRGPLRTPPSQSSCRGRPLSKNVALVRAYRRAPLYSSTATAASACRGIQ